MALSLGRLGIGGHPWISIHLVWKMPPFSMARNQKKHILEKNHETYRIAILLEQTVRFAHFSSWWLNQPS